MFIDKIINLLNAISGIFLNSLHIILCKLYLIDTDNDKIIYCMPVLKSNPVVSKKYHYFDLTCTTQTNTLIYECIPHLIFPISIVDAGSKGVILGASHKGALFKF